MGSSERKRILLVGKASGDPSLADVMDCLIYLGHDVSKLTGDDFEQFNSESFTIVNRDYKLESSNHIDFEGTYDAVWIRRWSDYNAISDVVNLLKEVSDSNLILSIVSILSRDISQIEKLVLTNLKARRTLSSYSELEVHKINTLLAAKKVGLLIPDFLLTTEKIKLVEFFNQCCGEVIVKDLDRTFHYSNSEERYTSYTEKINKDFISGLPDVFFLSFFQKYIAKQYEIRSFVLGRRIYSMAIFSQLDPQTAIDFRKYNFTKPNRMVPYQLPKVIEDSIIILFENLQLTTGSVDLIFGLDNEYYFLEVNPVGQYGFVSQVCNYNIDLEIAKYLIS